MNSLKEEGKYPEPEGIGRCNNHNHNGWRCIRTEGHSLPCKFWEGS